MCTSGLQNYIKSVHVLPECEAIYLAVFQSYSHFNGVYSTLKMRELKRQ